MTTTHLTERELTTILAALHYWQQDLAENEGPICDLFDDKLTPLTVEEIDSLYDRLNRKLSKVKDMIVVDWIVNVTVTYCDEGKYVRGSYTIGPKRSICHIAGHSGLLSRGHPGGIRAFNKIQENPAKGSFVFNSSDKSLIKYEWTGHIKI